MKMKEEKKNVSLKGIEWSEKKRRKKKEDEIGNEWTAKENNEDRTAPWRDKNFYPSLEWNV